MLLLKQSTAVTVMIGPFLDSTDGNTAETGLTISQADVRLSKNGGNMAQKGNATSCTHDELGYYGCPLSTTDTGTLGALNLMVHESGALAVWHEFMIVPANVYDSLIGGSDNLEVDAVAISGDSTAANNAESFFDGTGYAGTGNTIPTVTTLTGHTAQTGDNYARIGAPAGASVSADVAAVKAETALIVADTNELQTDDVPGLIAALNDLSAAEVNTEVDTGIADAALATAAALATVDGNVDTILVDTAELQTDWTNGGRLDLILDAVLADTNELQSDDVPGLIAALNDISTAEVNAEMVDALNVDTYAEPSGVPAATATLEAKIGWLAALARNKITQTADTQTLRNDADGADIAASTVSDNGTTFTRGEFS